MTSTTDFHVSNGSSSIGTGGAPKPALLNRKSRRPPNAFLVSANRRFTSSGLPTSAATATILPPPALASATVLSSSSLRRPVTTTFQPSPCSASAAERPMPAAAARDERNLALSHVVLPWLSRMISAAAYSLRLP